MTLRDRNPRLAAKILTGLAFTLAQRLRHTNEVLEEAILHDPSHS